MDESNETWITLGSLATQMYEARTEATYQSLQTSATCRNTYYFNANYNMAVTVPPPGGANGGNAIVIHDADGERLVCCDLEAC